MKFVVSFLLIFFTTLTVPAQFTFTATADLSSVPLNRNLKITYELNGAIADAFSPPDFGSFSIVSSQSGMSSGYISFGSSQGSSGSSKQSWEYTLRPSKTGRFTIQPAMVTVNGKSYQSNSISVKVTSRGTKPVAATKKSGKNQLQIVQDKKQKPKLMLKAMTSASNVYVGEQLTVTYRLYMQYQAIQAIFEDVSPAAGFWTEDVTDTSASRPRWIEAIDGETYTVTDIRVIVIIPQRSGRHTLPALIMKAYIPSQSQLNNQFFAGLLQQFFSQSGFGNMLNSQLFDQVTDVDEVESEPVSIQVNDLPKPPDASCFGGAVGQFSVESELDCVQCKTGDAVLLKIKVTGTGNIPLIEWPTLLIPEGIDFLSSDVRDDYQFKNGRIGGSRIFEFMLQPQKAGTYSIDPGVFCYFDPKTARFFRSELLPLTLDVSQGAQQSTTKTESEKKLIPPDARDSSLPIMPDPLLLAGFAIFAWLVFATVVFLVSKRARLKADPEAYRMKLAVKAAARRLRIARVKLLQNDDVSFYDELAKAMWLFVADQYGLVFSKLNIADISVHLRSIHVDDHFIETLIDILQKCDYARFSPATNHDNQLELFQKANSLLIVAQTQNIK